MSSSQQKRPRAKKDREADNRIKGECHRIVALAKEGFLEEASIDLRAVCGKEFIPNHRNGYAGKIHRQAAALSLLKFCATGFVPPPDELVEALELIMDVTPTFFEALPERKAGLIDRKEREDWQKFVVFGAQHATIEAIPAEKMAEWCGTNRDKIFELKKNPQFKADVAALRDRQAGRSPRVKISEKINGDRTRRKAERTRELVQVVHKNSRNRLHSDR